MSKIRLLNLLEPTGSEGKSRHYIGLPPALTGGRDLRKRLIGARFLVLLEDPDGYFIYRFDDFGNCVGDTWHATLSDAQAQATHEYGNALGHWIDIPLDIAPGLLEVRDFGLRKLAHG